MQVILRYSTMPEVVARCNATPYGLAAGILSKDLDTALAFARGVKAGSVWWVQGLRLFSM